MTIFQQGQVNPNALNVPDTYTQINSPPPVAINGVVANILAVVGVAIWGPVNSPVQVSGYAQGSSVFGALQARKYDLLTQVATAQQQGASNFMLVRVTDGTDLAASGTLACATNALASALANAINQGVSVQRGASNLVVASASGTTLTLTAKYTGSLGNSLVATLGAGAAASTSSLAIALPGQPPESFNNVGATSSTPSSVTLSGGTDGATTISGATLLGVDGTLRKGMYALRGTKSAVGLLADCDDPTTYSTQLVYALSESTEMVMTGPAGDTITNATATKASAGIDSPGVKLLFGDWVLWNDSVNNVTRYVSPQGFAAGKLAALTPNLSALNQQLLGIVATQKTAAQQIYTSPDLSQLATAGIDVITNPSPGGSYFSCRLGQNTSSNQITNDDSYPRLTNYLASTLNLATGKYVGRLQTKAQRNEARAAISSWLAALWTNGFIGNTKGTMPYSVQIDDNNNSDAQVALGYEYATVMVQYLSVVRYFLVNLTGGTTVQVSSTPTFAASA